MPQTGDDAVHLVAGKLAALARLRALCHLDLQLIGIDQIVRGDAKPCRGHLFDRAATPITIHILLVAIFVLAAFAGIRLASDAVHCNRQRLVRFLADRSEGHCASREALHDLFCRLDLVDRDWLTSLLDLHQTTQRSQILALLVYEICIFLERFEILFANAVLQLADGERVQQVIFAIHAEVIAATNRQLGICVRDRTERKFVLQLRLAGENIQTNTADAGACA